MRPLPLPLLLLLAACASQPNIERYAALSCDQLTEIASDEADEQTLKQLGQYGWAAGGTGAGFAMVFGLLNPLVGLGIGGAIGLGAVLTSPDDTVRQTAETVRYVKVATGECNTRMAQDG